MLSTTAVGGCKVLGDKPTGKLFSMFCEVLEKLDELVPAVAYYLRALNVDGTACAAAWLNQGAWTVSAKHWLWLCSAWLTEGVLALAQYNADGLWWAQDLSVPLARDLSEKSLSFSCFWVWVVHWLCLIEREFVICSVCAMNWGELTPDRRYTQGENAVSKYVTKHVAEKMSWIRGSSNKRWKRWENRVHSLRIHLWQNQSLVRSSFSSKSLWYSEFLGARLLSSLQAWFPEPAHKFRSTWQWFNLMVLSPAPLHGSD